MKKITVLFSALFMLTCASTALAAANGSAAFVIYSGVSASTDTSAVYDVRAFKTKTMHVSGVTLTSNATSITFKNMSGTAIVQGAPSSSGPWSTLVANDYAQTAVSLTSNGSMTWNDATPYIRFKWTCGTTGQKIKGYLNWQE